MTIISEEDINRISEETFFRLIWDSGMMTYSQNLDCNVLLTVVDDLVKMQKATSGE